MHRCWNFIYVLLWQDAAGGDNGGDTRAGGSSVRVRRNRERGHGNTTLAASIKVLQSPHTSPFHASVGNID